MLLIYTVIHVFRSRYANKSHIHVYYRLGLFFCIFTQMRKNYAIHDVNINVFVVVKEHH